MQQAQIVLFICFSANIVAGSSTGGWEVNPIQEEVAPFFFKRL